MLAGEDEELRLYQAFLSDPDTRLIAPAKTGAPSIDFRSGGCWRECRIWEGYFDASHLLLKQALEESPRADNLIFPALFNLRHAMEVALKWHIQYAGGTIPKRARHDLSALIEEFCRTANDLDEEASYISEYMLACISELASVDPHSTAFRYSTDLDGTPIDITPESWDLRRLYFTVSDLIVCFDGLSNRIDLSRDERYQAYLRGD